MCLILCSKYACGLLHLVQRGGDWAGCGNAKRKSFFGRAPPGPAGEFTALPQSPYLDRGEGRGKGRWKGGGKVIAGKGQGKRKGGKVRGTEWEGRGIPSE